MTFLAELSTKVTARAHKERYTVVVSLSGTLFLKRRIGWIVI